MALRVFTQILLAYALSHAWSVAKAEAIDIGFIERPPSIYANADGQMRGILGKKLANIFLTAKLDVNFVATQPEDLDTFIANTELDGFVATPTIVLSDSGFLFSEEPLVSLAFYAYHLESTPSLNGIEELQNASVILPISLDTFQGILKDTLEDPANKNTIAAIETDFERQMTLLKRGVGEYAVSYFSPDNIAMLFSNRSAKAKITTSPLFEIPLYLVLRTSAPNSQTAIEKINQSMAQE